MSILIDVRLAGATVSSIPETVVRDPPSPHEIDRDLDIGRMKKGRFVQNHWQHYHPVSTIPMFLYRRG
jgi:hypothetical protein